MARTMAQADNRVRNVSGIEGLSLLRAAIDQEAAERIFRSLTTQEWKRWHHWKPFSRQEFGFEYNISSRDVSATTAIPEQIRALFPALREAGWTGPDPSQVIVNRYPNGGSLGAHIDSSVFGPEVGAISLQTEWPIEFSQRRGGNVHAIPLPVLSAYVMRGGARTRWFHRIPPTHQAPRISLTFRTIAGSERSPDGKTPGPAATRKADAAADRDAGHRAPTRPPLRWRMQR